MYLPPPGRPISSPPSDHLNGVKPIIEWEPGKRGRKLSLTPEQVAALRADYLAGMPYTVMREKYGYRGNGTFRRLLKDLPRRINIPEPNQRPVQMPGETKQQYGARVYAWKMATDPEFRDRMIKIRKAVGRRVRRRNAARKAETATVPPTSMPECAPTSPPPQSWFRRTFGWLWS